MAELFLGKVLLKNNRDQDELETDKELWERLENRVLLLYFAESGSSRCQEFAPLLKDFFTKLTDEFYVDRSSQLALVYVTRDRSEEEHESFIKDMPKRWLLVPFENEEFRRDLEVQFSVSQVPVLVVLKPSGQVISPNAVDEVVRLGPPCFQNWQEVSEIVDRSFLAAEFCDSTASRSISDPIRRIKYKMESPKKKERAGRDNDDDDDGGGGGGGGGFF
ncbi:PREDICTED: nucleoredoxin-like protein 1 [Nanorana parkeri]|uniref:nucleoredoxin-like protein 1 n=1 Tax=Nanorana parkeri TaxID=125878 RepID=UPI000853F7EB|nr:PREDICTED: nucleoredoxin-like protein 1 [Nanorana parkeri]